MKNETLKINGFTVLRETFDSVIEFHHTLHTRPNTAIFAHRNQSHEGSEGFTKTASYTVAEDMLLHGWTEAAAKMTTKVDTHFTPDRKTSRSQYSVVGGQCSVPRYLQGIPTNMINRVPVKTAQKVVTINKNICYNACVSAETILEEGVKALQVIQSIESKGIRVRLNLVSAARDSKEIIVLRVCVKRPDEPLNISKIAFPIAHPSMLRRMEFKWTESNPHLTEQFSGYGSAVEDSAFTVADGEYYIPAIMGSDPEAWVTRTIG